VYDSLTRAKFEILSTDEVTRIHDASLDRLQTQEIVGGTRNGIPGSISPGPMAGASSPVTLAGTVAQANAEFLSGLVISQAASPGAPVIYACWARHLDQKTANVSMGTPEFALLRVCQAQVGTMAHQCVKEVLLQTRR